MAVLNEIEIDGVNYRLFDIDMVYPVGSVYITFSNTSPAVLFGGTWTKIEGKFIIGASSSYNNDSTGGASTHTHTNPNTSTFSGSTSTYSGSTGGHAITVDQMPSHSHSIRANTGRDDSNFTHVYGELQGGDSSDPNWYPSTGATGSGQAHSHTMNHSHTMDHSHTIGNTGSSSNIPPYIAANIWRRTA